MIEDELKRLRLSAPASGPRERVLAAAVTTRRDQRVGRWISGLAAMAVLTALLSVAIGEKEGPRADSAHPDMGLHPRYSFHDESIQEGGPWRR